MTIGERIKTIRGTLSQEEFASCVGVSKTAIGAYERNVSVPGSAFIISVCEHFNVQFEWLLLGKGPIHHSKEGPSLCEVKTSAELLPAPATLCSQCSELMKQLAVATERLHQANEEAKGTYAEVKALLKENGELRVELTALKNKPSATGNEKRVASAS